MKTSIKASLIAAAIATLPFGSQAAGLGSINVFSGLGQPLRAEIELNATPQEVQTLAARIAPVEAFRQANVSYSPVLTDIRVSVESRGNRSVLKLSSDRPVNEPFVDLLLELNWASGRLLREYTFLLDPVQLQPPPPVAAQRPSTGATTATSATMSAEPPVRDRAAPPVADRYQVKRGDTLRGIAAKHRPQSVSLDQMLIALFRENPAAFDDSNANRLRAGAILQIPTESAAGAVEPAQARREIVAQAADFEAYRRSLAGAVASRPAESEPAGSRSGAGAIVPAVEESQRPRDTGDRVTVTGAPSTETSAATTAADDSRLARLQALEEELVARDKALEDANARLAALEASIRDMQQLLELRSQGMAQVQEQAAGAAAIAPAAEQPPAPEAPVVAASTEPAAPAPVQPAPAAEPEAQPEPSFLQTLLQDPLTLAGGGGILALLLGYGGYKVRQRRKAEEGVRDSMAMISEMPPESKSVFGATGGQSVNTTDSSVIQTDFSQSGLSAIDADEGVDPVAEADVYMAYGRDAQAEEILLDALKADASRLAIYLKLLEIYAQRKSLKPFETTATDLYSRTGGEGAEWTKAADLGRKIDPENPLYRATAAEGTATGGNRPGDGKGSAGVAATAALGGAAGVAVAAGLGAGESVKDESIASSDGDMIDLDFGADDAEDIQAAPVEPSPSQLKDTWAMPGDLSEVSRALDGGSDEDVSDAVNAAIKPEELAEALPEIDSDALDFDLDAGLGLDDDAEGDVGSKGSSELIEEASASVGGVDDLEFDLDIGDEAEKADAKPDSEPRMDATMVGDGLDFLSDDDADQSLEENAEATGESDGFDLNATVVQSAEPVSDTDSETMDLEKTSFDSSLLDFDFDIESTKPEGLPEAPSLDLTSIDLNLDPHDDESPAVTDEEVIDSDAESIEMPELSDEADDAGAESVAEDSTDEPSEEVIQEVDTKLELARAYEEMGDKDGARELVEEVLREGSSEQREAAKLLMERLA